MSRFDENNLGMMIVKSDWSIERDECVQGHRKQIIAISELVSPVSLYTSNIRNYIKIVLEVLYFP